MKRIFTYAIFAAALMMATGCDIEEDLEALREEESSGSGDVRESLIAYYTFDDETGRDKTDNERDGNFTNDPSFITDTPNGKGKALHLINTKQQTFIIPYSVMGSYNSDITVAFWLKDFGRGFIFRENISSDYYGRGFVTDADFLACTRVESFTVKFDYQGKSIMSSGWHHITLTYLHDNDTYSLYIDGKKMDEVQGSIYSGWSTSQGGKVVFAQKSATSFKIDNIRFYNRVLDADEVRRIYDYEK